MKFEWNEEKRQSNARKHGIDFVDAVEIFEGVTVMVEDDRFDYGERRFISIGLARERVIVVVHTEEAGIIRLISARKATKYEARKYFERIAD
jgi:uncharacterized DUF497 family protein